MSPSQRRATRRAASSRGHTLFRALIIALFGLWTQAALAHPHIFIEAGIEIEFDDDGRLAALRHSWRFDSLFSTWTVQGLDVNGDGVTSPGELQELADENLVGLASYSFYTFAGIGPRNLAFTVLGTPGMRFADDRVTLDFALAPTEAVRLDAPLEIAVSDPDYYVAITFAGPEAVRLVNAPDGCAARLEPPRDLDPALEEQLLALGPDVMQLPPELAQAMRGVQGAIIVDCGPTAATAQSAADAAAQLAQARPTPFGGPPPEPSLPLPRDGLLGWVAEQQKQFYAAINDALAVLRTDANAFWILGGLSFLYGVFHAAGPGHGKVVISSYMLANESELRRGVALSFASAMLQAVVAVAFVLVAAGLLRLGSLAMSEAANWVGIASYALVAALGLWLVVRHLFGLGHRHHQAAPATAIDWGETGRPAHDHAHGGDHHHHHDHDHPHAHAHDHGHGDGAGHAHHLVTPAQARGDWREQLGVVLAVGLRPCSGALVVLVFALSQGLLAAGIASVFLMALGTALTVAVLAMLAIGAKGLALRLGNGGGAVAAKAVWWLELAGALAVLAFGVVLLVASLAVPF